MIDETKHLKISVATLSRPDDYPTDEWFDWLEHSAESEMMTFTQVTDDGVSRWETTQSTFYPVETTHFLGFKAGAVYEAEAGKRTVFGQKLTAGKYLDFYDALKPVGIETIPFEMVAKLTIDSARETHLLSRGEFKWCHQHATITRAGDNIEIVKPIKNLLDWAFLKSNQFPMRMTLKPLTHHETQSRALAYETADLFA